MNVTPSSKIKKIAVKTSDIEAGKLVNLYDSYVHDTLKYKKTCRQNRLNKIDGFRSKVGECWRQNAYDKVNPSLNPSKHHISMARERYDVRLAVL